MKMHFARGFYALAVLIPLAHTSDIHEEVDDTDISHRYIVTLHPSADLSSHLNEVHTLHLQTASNSKQSFDGISHNYTLPTFQAYAGHFSPTLISLLHRHPSISLIEPDSLATLTSITKPRVALSPTSLIKQSNPPFGLSLISHRGASPDHSYWYAPSASANTYAYIIDSGIQLTHLEFSSRATHGYTALRNASAADRSGHGTHTAGIVGARTWGVAKRALLISVKAFSHAATRTSVVLDGFTWAASDIAQHRRQPRSVVLVAAAAPYSAALNAAVDAAYAQGVTTVTGAGNTGQRASSVSPASAEGALAVGATDDTRRRAAFSGWGPSVGMFAPGVDVRSAWIGPETSEERTGTSPAAAYVAGVVLCNGLGVKRRGLFGKKRGVAKGAEMVKELATRDVVGEPKGSRNLFVYNGSGR